MPSPLCSSGARSDGPSDAPTRACSRPPTGCGGLADPGTVNETVRVRVVQLLSVAALLVAWRAVAPAGWVDPPFVPAPSAVARALRRIGAAAPAALGGTLL